MTARPMPLARSSVQTAALRGLGALGDPLSLAAVEAFTTASDSRIAAAAKDAVTAINQRTPLESPQEVVALRNELAELKTENATLSDDVAAIRKQLESLLKAHEEAHEEAAEQAD